ncbi:MAG: ATP synthase F0 subunit B [Candidatus Aminicenantes bacterium]|nr:ATP synthase F0 subunit B [Candidatus Aminicenantes bacterium]
MKGRTAAWLGILLLAVAPCLRASEESAHHGGGMDFIGKVLNFLVLFGGLAYILHKPLRAFLRKRTENVRLVLEESEKDRLLADEKLRSARERLAGLASEVEAMKRAAEAEGRAEQDRIRRLAAEEAEKIKRLARADMESRVRAGVRELKRHAAALAVERAGARIRERLTSETQAVLIEGAIKDLAGRDEKEGPDPKVRPRAH